MSNEYERRAREAERLARDAKTDQERAAHEQVAQLWRDLAQRRKSKTPPGDGHGDA
jgi:hypothetical protein